MSNGFCKNCKPSCKKEVIEGYHYLTGEFCTLHFRFWETKNCTYKFSRKECSCGCKNPVKVKV